MAVWTSPHQPHTARETRRLRFWKAQGLDLRVQPERQPVGYRTPPTPRLESASVTAAEATRSLFHLPLTFLDWSARSAASVVRERLMTGGPSIGIASRSSSAVVRSWT